MTTSHAFHARSPAPQPCARRVLVVFNPTAGRRGGRLAAILAALEAQDCEVVLRKTAGPGDATRIARDESRGFDVLAVAGGDGTINEAANGLAELGPDAPALAVLPFGTANVLAHEIGLGLDEARVARTVATGRTETVHLGTVSEPRGTARRFLLMAGIGFDAAVVAGVDTRLKRRIGKGAYVWRMLVELWRYGYARYMVTVDGERHACASAVVAKGRFYGGRFVCAPDACLNEPDFQVCLFLRAGRLHVLRYSLALALGRLPKLPDVRLLRGRDIRLEGPFGAPIQADGDIVARLPSGVTIATHPLRLLYPQ